MAESCRGLLAGAARDRPARGHQRPRPAVTVADSTTASGRRRPPMAAVEPRAAAEAHPSRRSHRPATGDDQLRQGEVADDRGGRCPPGRARAGACGPASVVQQHDERPARRGPAAGGDGPPGQQATPATPATSARRRRASRRRRRAPPGDSPAAPTGRRHERTDSAVPERRSAQSALKAGSAQAPRRVPRKPEAAAGRWRTPAGAVTC